MGTILFNTETSRHQSRRGGHSAWLDWTPLVVLPLVAMTLVGDRAGWIVMWSVAVGVFAGCKWLMWRATGRHPLWPPLGKGGMGWWRSVAYFVAWPGLDAGAFLDGSRRGPAPPVREWLLAVLKTVVGAVLLWYVAGKLWFAGAVVVGWVGVAGLILVLHCGVFHLLALAWQRAGVSVVPIMRAPLLAVSLSDFWGRRWNLAFRDFAHRCVFVPAQRRLGGAAAVMASFVVSGVLHELVISVPARAGYGLPTAYFALQGFGMLVERSALFRHRTKRGGLAPRLYAIVVVLGPAWLLFHPAFVSRVMLPFMRAIGAL